MPPLSGEEQLRLDRALRRLHECMRKFWSAWPLARRTASQISRELEVDRTTCQRLAWLAGNPYTGTAMLDSLPGPRAFRNLLEACDQNNAPPSPQVRAALDAAVNRFDELLRECGGSLSHLKRRIAATPMHALSPAPLSAPEPSDGLHFIHAPEHDQVVHWRESMFHAVRHLTGRHSQATASIGLYDSVGTGPNELRHVRISGSSGIVARPNAVPMVIEAFEGVDRRPADAAERPGAAQEQPAETDRWQRTPALLCKFTSAAWRAIELSPSPGFASRAMEITRSETPSDVYIYTAFPVPDPRTLGQPIEESWYIPYNPTAALVFDLYLHESIARRCLVSLDIHLWQTSFANHPHGEWHTRMPQSPTVTQLGRGMRNAASPLHPLQHELTEELFRLADVDPDAYIGFRCEERFPVWRAGYRYELDFGRSD